MNQTFFQTNRKKFIDALDHNAIVILFSGKIIPKSADQDFPFEVNKNFYYLTGINQANVTYVAIKLSNEVKEWLFIDEYDESMSKWVGKTLSIAETKEISGIDMVLFHKDFNQFIYQRFNSTRHISLRLQTLYLDLERRSDKDYTSPALTFSADFVTKYPEITVKNAYDVIVSLRMIKSDSEIACIKESIQTTKEALQVMMKHIKPGRFEYELESIFNHHIHYHANKRSAFETICAVGKNATVLHYVLNNALLENQQLILFDLGCKTQFYVSDITRTYPVGGKFTKRQKEIYEIVLETNKACIAYAKPGMSWTELNQYANQILIAGLKRLKLITADDELQKYYWHSIGHSIGLDTHDPTIHALDLKEGMVITIEPGLYLEDEGIGIRIEDNILLTNNGNINLSKDIIKEIKDIESMMSE